ncbi:YcaO-like family protein [Arthrobacter sp. NPDC055585]
MRTPNAKAAAMHKNRTLSSAFRAPLPVPRHTIRQDENPDVLIWDRSGSADDLCAAIQAELRLVGVQSATYNISNSDNGTPIFVLHHHESRFLDEDLTKALENHKIIWCFDSIIGTAVGPLIETIDEFDCYVKSTSAFVEDIFLDNLFPQARPCSIGGSQAPPLRIAEAISLFLRKADNGLVYVIGSQGLSRKRLVHSLLRFPARSSARDELESPFGVCRSINHEVISSPLGDLYVSSCKSPAGAVHATLEGNSGKAFTGYNAAVTMFGESVERTAAYFANQLPSSPKLSSDVGLESFAPFGAQWDRRSTHADEDERVVALELATGGQTSIPKVLAAYPYEPPPGILRPTRGDTTGFAAYPNRVGSVLRGLREVLERDSLYTNFLHQRRGFRLAPEYAGDYIIERIWYGDCPFPAIHAFVFARDGVLPLVGRGSGSGLTWDEASLGATVECFQILEQMRRGAPDHEGSAYVSWRNQRVQRRLESYIHSMPLTNPSLKFESTSDDEQLDSLIRSLSRAGERILVVALPSPVIDLVAVRVLVPGRVTNVHSTAGLGGERLVDIKWKEGFPV